MELDWFEIVWFLIDCLVEVGVVDDSGMIVFVMMISKMLSVVSGVNF